MKWLINHYKYIFTGVFFTLNIYTDDTNLSGGIEVLYNLKLNKTKLEKTRGRILHNSDRKTQIQNNNNVNCAGTSCHGNLNFKHF